MFRKKCMLECGEYNLNMKGGLEDWDFWLNFVEKNKKFYHINEFLFYYRIRKNSRQNEVAHNDNKYKKLRNQIRKNHPNLFAYFWMYKILFVISRFFWQKKITSSGKLRIKILKLPITIPHFLSREILKVNKK